MQEDPGRNYHIMTESKDATMKALLFSKYGPVKQVLSVGTRPRPTIKSDFDILLRVYSASINPIDFKLAQGALKAFLPRTFPAMIGLDVSGVIEAVGSKVTKFKKGDAVYASAKDAGFGTVAEYYVTQESQCALKPSSMTHDQACCLGVAALTAWRCLTWRGKLKAGQKVFITAGAGGVGMFAIQQANKVLGASVTTTCSGAKSEFCKSMGAEICIDYKKEDFEQKAKDYDVGLDATGEFRKMFNVIKTGGICVSVSGPPHGNSFEEMPNTQPNCCIMCCLNCCACNVRRAAANRNVAFYSFFLAPHGEDLVTVGKHVEEGKVKIHIDKAFSLDQSPDAMEYLSQNKATGKVVIHVLDEPKEEKKQE
jgi:NADPH:quinone reductase-like Zn-dependent oxidoreductase